MTIKELASLTNKLFRKGKGDHLAYFKIGPVSYPITSVEECKILTANSLMMQFSWSAEKEPNYVADFDVVKRPDFPPNKERKEGDTT